MVTGVGALSCAGEGVPALWAAVRDGRTAYRTETHERSGSQLPIGRIPDFRPSDHFDAGRMPLLDRTSQIAILATREAILQAGLPKETDKGRIACLIGSGGGAAHTQDEASIAFHGLGKRRLHPLTIPKGMFSAVSSQVAMDQGLLGPNFTVSSACASSAHAIGEGFEMVARGIANMAVVGGAEACLTPGYLTAWQGMHILAQQACRPFSANRDGLVLSEGAAILVLEDHEAAIGRGATILAEVLGYGSSSDAGAITAPSAEGMARAMSAAMTRAAVHPAEVDAINAHGTGTEANDSCESAALALTFGDRSESIPVSGVKAVLGHALGAAAALEAVTSVMTLQSGFLPPTANHCEPDAGCPIDCVPNVGRSADVDVVLSNSFAFGGLNATLVFGR